jgi:hypothetical protein
MKTRLYKAPRSHVAPAVHTSRPRHQLWIAAAAAGLAITLAACGSDITRRDTDAHPTPDAEIARQYATRAPEVRLPDLTDPATRKQLVCSFAEGYFTPPQPPAETTSECG